MKPILVVGDAMHDVYHLGAADRLSAECPIPVVKIKMTLTSPGGAANVAKNLEAMGEGVRTVFGFNRPTKNRLVVGDRQIARWDTEDWCEPPQAGVLGALLKSCRAVVVSDYRKGSITAGVVEQIAQAGLPTFVDTKGDPSCWLGKATVVFPNEKEYAEYQKVYEQFRLVVLKRGQNGMELRGNWNGRSELWFSAAAEAKQVRSVNGAGDTVLAAFVSEHLRNGCSETVANRAWRFAAAAAAAAVERPYTAVVERQVVEERLGRAGRVAA